MVAKELAWVMEHGRGGGGTGAEEGGGRWELCVEDVQQFERTAPGPGEEGKDHHVQRGSLSLPLPRRTTELIFHLFSAGLYKSADRSIL